MSDRDGTNPCPINKPTSTQRVWHKQVTASQRQRAEETIDIMETWADGANRRDKLEEDWDGLRAEVENPNLRDFQKLLEKEVTPQTHLHLHIHPHLNHTSPSPIHTHTFTLYPLRNVPLLLTVDVKPC